MSKEILKNVAAYAIAVAVFLLVIILVVYALMYAWNHGPAAFLGLPHLTDWWQAFWTLFISGLLFRGILDVSASKRHREIKELLETLVKVQVTSAVTGESVDPIDKLSLLMNSLGVDNPDVDVLMNSIDKPKVENDVEFESCPRCGNTGWLILEDPQHGHAIRCSHPGCHS